MSAKHILSALLSALVVTASAAAETVLAEAYPAKKSPPIELTKRAVDAVFGHETPDPPADEAIEAGRSGVQMGGPADWFNRHYNRLQLIRIYLALGRTGPALDELEVLMRERYYISPAWLRLDPLFRSLRNEPRFQRLAGTV